MRVITRQSGVALLVAMMLLLTGSALYLSGETQQKTKGNEVALQSLLAAKQALLAYAVNYADNYGHNTRGGTGRLPCPALTRFSSPARSCGSGAIGYLPSVWTRDGRRIEIDYLERFLDRDIWYSVSVEHRYNPSYNKLNSNKGVGLLTVDSLQDIVAVLIAPGAATIAQDRAGSVGLALSAVVSDYLEGENADSDTQFTLNESNDLLVPVRRSELLPLMERRVLGFVKQWLIEYKSTYGFYPYASELGTDGKCKSGLLRGLLSIEVGSCMESSMVDMHYSDLPAGRTLRQTWFHRYDWPSLIYYVVDESCAPSNGVTDCDGIGDPERTLLVNGKQAEVVLISVGEPIQTDSAGGLQVRAIPDLTNYLDTVELLSSTTIFSGPALSDQNNDQLVFIE